MEIDEGAVVREDDDPYPVGTTSLLCFPDSEFGFAVSLRMHTSATLVRSAVLLGLVGGLLCGCGGRGTPPKVSSGEFTAYVEGSLSDTLSGDVHHRITEEGTLTGLELGPKDGVGLSIELEPLAPALRSYEVVDAELFGITRPNHPPGVMAFLTLDEGKFESVEGTFELTYVDEEQIGATFTFQMEGGFDSDLGEVPSVEVTGALNAAPE